MKPVKIFRQNKQPQLRNTNTRKKLKQRKTTLFPNLQKIIDQVNKNKKFDFQKKQKKLRLK
jgi:hypothetical protein